MGQVRRVCAFDHGVLCELATWPNGSGAVALVMPGTALWSLERKGLAAVVREDESLGRVYAITPAGRASLQAGPKQR